MKRILFSTILITIILLTGCSTEKQDGSSEENPLMKLVTQEANKIVEQVKQSTDTLVQEATKQGIPAIDTIKDDITKKVEEVKKEVEVVAKDVQQKVEAVSDAVKPQDKGAQLYVKCSVCHGQNGEKPALNNSEIIKGWEVQRTVDALNGYKNGTYGKNMKSIMTGQVTSLTQEDIQAIAEYISKL